LRERGRHTTIGKVPGDTFVDGAERIYFLALIENLQYPEHLFVGFLFSNCLGSIRYWLYMAIN